MCVRRRGAQSWAAETSRFLSPRAAAENRRGTRPGEERDQTPEPARDSSPRVGKLSPPASGRGRGLGQARRSQPRRGGGRGGPARSRAFPARSPASCVLWSRPSPLPCWIVRPPPPPKEGWRRSWEFNAVAGVQGQRPSGQTLAGREQRASLSQRGPPTAPPSLGLLPVPEELRDAAPLTPLLPPLSPRRGSSIRPLAGGDGPGLPTLPAKP